MGTALALVGYSAAIYRTQAFPQWVAYVGFVGAVLGIIAGLTTVPTAEQSGIGILGLIAPLVFLLWVLIVSVWMVRPGPAATEQPPRYDTAAG